MDCTLKPDANLLDDTFETYKIAPRKPTVITAKNDHAAMTKKLPEQFSLHKAIIHARQNLLCEDVYTKGLSFFISEDGDVIAVSYDNLTSDSSIQQSSVFKIPEWKTIKDCAESPIVSMRFLSQHGILIYDGVSKIYYLSSEDRANPWKLIASLELKLTSGFSHLEDAVLTADGSTIHCVFLSAPKDCTEKVAMDWLVLEKDDRSQLKQARADSVNFKNVPDYISFEYETQSLCVLTDGSANLQKEDPKAAQLASNSAKSAPTIKSLMWHQGPQADGGPCTLHLVLNLTGEFVQSAHLENFVYSFALDAEQRQSFAVSYRKTPESEPIKLVEEFLLGHVKQDTVKLDFCRKTTSLAFTLHTEDSQAVWPRLFHTENLDTPFIVECDSGVLNRASSATDELLPDNGTPMEQFNLQQYENIDTGGGDNFEDLVVTRFAFRGEKVEQVGSAKLCGEKWLGNCSLKPGAKGTKACCVRYDVDGAVWVPTGDAATWMEHRATLQAFGYVLASKEQHRFVALPPSVCEKADIAGIPFVAVSDCNKRVYIYCQPCQANNDPDTQVRKRLKGSNGEVLESKLVHTAWQYVHTLNSDEEIVGLCAVTEPKPGCVVLTKSNISFIEVPVNDLQ